MNLGRKKSFLPKLNHGLNRKANENFKKDFHGT